MFRRIFLFYTEGMKDSLNCWQLMTSAKTEREKGTHHFETINELSLELIGVALD